MTVLDIIKQMKAQGYPDNDIVNNLQQQGISPRQISEALSQSNVKQAVYGESSEYSSGQQAQTAEYGQMQPSIMASQEEPQEVPKPGTQQQTPSYESGQGYMQPSTYEFPAEQQGYQEDIASIDMITEVADQIATEKLSKANKNIQALIETKIILATKVEKIDERLKQIESVIDALQMSLLRRSTEQGQNLEDIQTEIKSMQNSFGKIINPLTDKIREITPKPKKEKKQSARKISKVKKV